ncbi:MAG: outer membrane protein TolC [Chitinophagaceae bacterium]|nr:outer membrane protein TolC [Chitinophagaceae bacterium]
MKKLSLFTFLLLSMSVCLKAQNNKPLSLNEALSYALQNRRDVKIEHLNVQIAENEVKKVNSKNLPQLTSDLDVRYNTQLQTNVLPGAIFGSPGNDRAVQFGTTYNTLWGLNLNQNLFNPTNKGDKQIAKVQAEYNRIGEKKTELAVKQEVTEAYYSALLWKEKAKLSGENLKRANAVFTTSKDQLAQGSITSYDYQRYRIDYENAISEHDKNKNNVDLALSGLYYKIGSDSIQSDSLSDNISSLYATYQSTNLSSVEVQRPELEMEKMQYEIYELGVKKQNFSYLPTISFYANYSWQYLNSEFNPTQSKYWYPFNYLGLKASIPLFDGFLKERTKTEYRLKSESSRLKYEKLKSDYNQETNTALTSVKNAQTDLDAQKKNLELANELYRIDGDRLRNGTIKPNDLTITYYTLQQTQTNYLNAAYNYLIAIMNYKKATGSL